MEYLIVIAYVILIVATVMVRHALKMSEMEATTHFDQRSNHAATKRRKL